MDTVSDVHIGDEVTRRGNRSREVARGGGWGGVESPPVEGGELSSEQSRRLSQGSSTSRKRLQTLVACETPQLTCRGPNEGTGSCHYRVPHPREAVSVMSKTCT